MHLSQVLEVILFGEPSSLHLVVLLCTGQDLTSFFRVLQAKEILFTKRLLNGYMSEYTDQPTDKIEVCVRCLVRRVGC